MMPPGGSILESITSKICVEVVIKNFVSSSCAGVAAAAGEGPETSRCCR